MDNHVRCWRWRKAPGMGLTRITPGTAPCPACNQRSRSPGLRAGDGVPILHRTTTFYGPFMEASIVMSQRTMRKKGR